MPQAVPYVTAFFYGAAAGASAGLIAAATLGAIAQTVLINMALGAIAKALGPKGAGGNRTAINVSIRSTTASRSVIFGTVRAGGVFVFYRCSGSNNKYLHYVIAYAGHECNDITDVWIDNIKILDANINPSTGAVTQAPFTGKLNIWRYTGTSTQAADSTLVSAFSGVWTSAHQLKGITYIHARMERSDEAFPQGSPQSFTAKVEGAKLYDPREDSTNGGSGSQRYTDPSTWTFPTNPNPALALRWVLTGGSVTTDVSSPHVKYGLKDANSRIDDAYVTAAANECDEVLSGSYETPLGDQYRYACNIELSTGQTPREWIDDILATMAGTCHYVNGKWRVYAGAYDSPVHTITDADIYDDIQIQDTTGHEDRFNAIAAVYRDSENDYIEQTTEFRTDSAYETQDGGERIPRELDLPGVTTDPQAQRLCEIEKRKSRLMRSVKIVGALNLLKIAPWETFTLSNTKFGWTNRVFRCLERQFLFGEEAGRVEITARVESPDVWSDMETADYADQNSHTPVENLELPDPATGLTATTVLQGIHFAVTLPAYFGDGSLVQLYEYTANTPFASASLVAEFRGNTYVLPKSDEITRYYWVRIRDVNLQTSTQYPSGNGVAGVARHTNVIRSSTNAASLHLDITTPDDEYVNIDYITFTAPLDGAAVVRVSYQGQLVNSGGGSSSGISGEGMAYIAETSDVAGTLQAGQPVSHTFDNGGLTVEGVFEVEQGVEYQAGLRLHVVTSTSDAQVWARQLTIVIEERRGAGVSL